MAVTNDVVPRWRSLSSLGPLGQRLHFPTLGWLSSMRMQRIRSELHLPYRPRSIHRKVVDIGAGAIHFFGARLMAHTIPISPKASRSRNACLDHPDPESYATLKTARACITAWLLGNNSVSCDSNKTKACTAGSATAVGRSVVIHRQATSRKTDEIS